MAAALQKEFTQKSLSVPNPLLAPSSIQQSNLATQLQQNDDVYISLRPPIPAPAVPTTTVVSEPHKQDSALPPLVETTTTTTSATEEEIVHIPSINTAVNSNEEKSATAVAAEYKNETAAVPTVPTVVVEVVVQQQPTPPSTPETTESSSSLSVPVAFVADTNTSTSTSGNSSSANNATATSVTTPTRRITAQLVLTINKEDYTFEYVLDQDIQYAALDLATTFCEKHGYTLLGEYFQSLQEQYDQQSQTNQQEGKETETRLLLSEEKKKEIIEADCIGPVKNGLYEKMLTYEKKFAKAMKRQLPLATVKREGANMMSDK